MPIGGLPGTIEFIHPARVTNAGPLALEPGKVPSVDRSVDLSPLIASQLAGEGTTNRVNTEEICCLFY